MGSVIALPGKCNPRTLKRGLPGFILDGVHIITAFIRHSTEINRQRGRRNKGRKNFLSWLLQGESSLTTPAPTCRLETDKKFDSWGGPKGA